MESTSESTWYQLQNIAVDRFVRRRWWLASFAIGLALLAIVGRQKLVVDYRIESMFAQNDPQFAAYQALKQRFGGSEISLCVVRDRRLFDPSGEGIERLGNLAAKLRSVKGVQAAFDLSYFDELLKKSANPLSWLNLSNQHPILDERNAFAQQLLKTTEGLTHSKDRSSAAIVCLFDPDLRSQTERNTMFQQLYRAVEQWKASEPESEAYWIGEPILVHEGFQLVQQDGQRLGVLSSLLLGVLLLVLTESLRWSFICILVVQWSILVTEGILGWFAWHSSMVSSMLTSLVTVIGVATIIHWMTRFERLRGAGSEPTSALVASLKLIFRPMFCACVTDAVAFSSLLAAKVGPVRDYGLMMTVASLVVLAGVVMIVPAIALLAQYNASKRIHWQWPRVARWLSSTLELAVRHRWLGAGITLVLIGVSILGSWRLKIESNLLQNFDPELSIVKNVVDFEENFGGSGVWDVMISTPKPVTDEILDKVLGLQKALLDLRVDSGGTTEPLRVTQVLSVADLNQSAKTMLPLRLLPAPERLAAMREFLPAMFDLIVAPSDAEDQTFIRLLMRSSEQAPSENRAKLIDAVRQKVDRFVADELQPKATAGQSFQADVTGVHVLITDMVNQVLQDQWICFLLAVGGIAVALLLALRNVWWVLAGLLPNILPPLIVMGCYGWLNVPINLGVALVGAVAVGLSVDGSFHYLINFQRALREGQSPRQALSTCQSEVGVAMILATVALLLGFGSLATSYFRPTAMFGLTTVLTMLGGLIGNLVLLPMALSLLFDIRKTTETNVGS